MRRASRRPFGFPLAFLVACAALASAAFPTAGKRPLTFVDLMKLRTVHDATIADDGAWIAYQAKPDRGDSAVVIRATSGSATTYVVERAGAPMISADSRFVAALVAPSVAAAHAAKDEDEDQQPKPGAALVATADGTVTTWDRVQDLAFSNDAGWLAIHHHEPAPAADEDAEDAAEAGHEEAAHEEVVAETIEGEDEDPAGDAADEPERVGTTLELTSLGDSARSHTLEHVEQFAFDETGRFLAYAVATPTGDNGLFVLDLTSENAQPHGLHETKRGRYTALAWPRDVPRLGFVAATDDEEGEPGDGAVWTWAAGDEAARMVVDSNAVGSGWRIPAVNELTWSRDGARLFFGRKPDDADDEDPVASDPAFDPYDVDALLAERGVDVWHWNDPRINPNQKERWDEEEKDRTYRAVLHLADQRVVLLADEALTEVGVADHLDNPTALLGLADTPYLKELTWDGTYHDVYRLALGDGSRQRVAEKLRGGDDNAALSPDGRFVVYYRTPHWYLFDGDTGTTRNLTKPLEVPFANEDHDYPQPAPGYGLAGWVAADTNAPTTAVLIYDKYDIWSFATTDGAPTCLTDGQGRTGETVFRAPDLDDERDFIATDERLLLTGYRDRVKSWGFYALHEGRQGVETLVAGDYKVAVVAKAKDADRLLFTRERYDEFPDLRVASLDDLATSRRLSDVNPQIADFAWGKAELVSWQSADGLPLDGVLIKPGNYQPGERYPVLVYYYRFFSQRLHEFNQPVINHRPSFPLYASNGYAVFLPDIRFEVGRPGPAATKSLVPGVQKLIEMGIADPDAIGLHGHSWSGYQTAFVVTQTNRFAAAVAGAPVSNMTSAYGGIRWGSGRSRQFQYEQSQSRLGGSLWQARDHYIDNSPIFFADRIETPLLLMFGDEDEAVPWYQGIELYMALRRLGKDAIFLQYRGEGHHPKQYPNKLDYSIKMKEYFDHYLKGEPAADWITNGVPYRGE